MLKKEGVTYEKNISNIGNSTFNVDIPVQFKSRGTKKISGRSGPMSISLAGLQVKSMLRLKITLTARLVIVQQPILN